MSLPRAVLDDAVARGVEALLAEQRDGHFEGEMRWCPMLTAQYVILHAFLGRPLPEARRAAILRYFDAVALDEGVWGLHAHAGPSLFTTSLVYVASRLVGREADDPRLAPARALFAHEGGVTALPTWGRAWLALVGLYPWEGLHPIPPELWALPDALPFHPSRFYCHTRQIYLGLSLLRAAEPVAPSMPLRAALREELFPVTPYADIPFRASRSLVSALDRAAPEHPLLRLAYGVAARLERVYPRALRRRVEASLRARIRWELSTTDHMAISPVSGMLGLIALHVADPRDPAIEPAIEALEAWAFEDEEEGYRLTGARSQTWDTAFALSALEAAGAPLLPDAVGFLAAQQIDAPFEGYRAAYRLDPTGGFCFAHGGHGWPVSDCTAEALLALFDTPELEQNPDRFHRGVEFLLRCQNVDGAFGSYEARRTELPLEAFNPSEMFLDCMREGSYVECTSSCVVALARYVERFDGSPLAAEARAATLRGRDALLRAQRADGAFDAAWGVHFIYGTLFGVRGLRAAGLPAGHPALERAARYLIDRQRPDGGFGEHALGARVGRYVALDSSQVVQTAWALLALVESGSPAARAASARAAAFLLERQREDGGYPRERMSGVFFRTALVDYDLYRVYFPLWALGRYRSSLKLPVPKAGDGRAHTGDDGGVDRRHREALTLSDLR